MTMLSQTSTGFAVRDAHVNDITAMMELMDPFVAVGDLLPRTPLDLARDIATYVVAVDPAARLIGVGALRAYEPTLAEVQALAVHSSAQGMGVGRVVVEALSARAKVRGVREVFALTRRPAFFHRLGFDTVGKERFPLKIWADCDRCPRQHACDEIAVSIDVTSSSLRAG